MSERQPTRTFINCSVWPNELISAVVTMAERLRPGECAEWDAERLETAARLIREKAKESDRGK